MSSTSAEDVFHAVKLNLTEEVLQTIGVVTFGDVIEYENLYIADLVKINRLHECHILTLDKRSLKLKFQNPGFSRFPFEKKLSKKHDYLSEC